MSRELKIDEDSVVVVIVPNYNTGGYTCSIYHYTNEDKSKEKNTLDDDVMIIAHGMVYAAANNPESIYMSGLEAMKKSPTVIN